METFNRWHNSKKIAIFSPSRSFYLFISIPVCCTFLKRGKAWWIEDDGTDEMIILLIDWKFFREMEFNFHAILKQIAAVHFALLCCCGGFYKKLSCAFVNCVHMKLCVCFFQSFTLKFISGSKTLKVSFSYKLTTSKRKRQSSLNAFKNCYMRLFTVVKAFLVNHWQFFLVKKLPRANQERRKGKIDQLTVNVWMSFSISSFHFFLLFHPKKDASVKASTMLHTK